MSGTPEAPSATRATHVSEGPRWASALGASVYTRGMPTAVHTVSDLVDYVVRDAHARGDDPANELARREAAPDLYDCAIAIGELDHPDLVAELLARGTFGVDDSTPRSGETLLRLATSRSRVTSFGLLVAAGADVTQRYADRDLLFWAVFSDADPAIAERLMAAGIAPTPEHLDVARRRAGRDVRELLARGTSEGKGTFRHDAPPVRTTAPPAVTKGATVRVTTGAFTGAQGTVVELTAETRTVKVALVVFGQTMSVELPEADVSALT